MLYGKRLAVPLKAVWSTELAKAYAETVHGTTRGYTKHRLHATVKSNTTVFYGQVPCVRVEWDELPAGLHQGHKLPVRGFLGDSEWDDAGNREPSLNDCPMQAVPTPEAQEEGIEDLVPK